MKWNKLRQLYRQNKHQFWKYIFYQFGIFLLTFGSAFGLFFLIDFLSEKMGYGHPSSSTRMLIVIALMLLAFLIFAIIYHLLGKDKDEEECEKPKRWYQNFWIQIAWFIVIISMGFAAFFFLDTYLEKLPQEWAWIYIAWKFGKKVVLFVLALIIWLRTKWKKKQLKNTPSADK